MLYINATPNDTGYFGNPQSTQTDGMTALPEEFLDQYIAAKGFVLITTEKREFTRSETQDVENEETGAIETRTLEIPYAETVVTTLEVNQEALDTYLAEHQDTPEQHPEATQLDRIEAQAMYTALMTDTLLEED